MGHPDVFNQNADDAGGLGDKTSCGFVWAVIVFFQESLYLFPGFFMDSRFVVYHPGDRAGRYAGFFCNVINCFCTFHDFSIRNIRDGVKTCAQKEEVQEASRSSSGGKSPAR